MHIELIRRVQILTLLAIVLGVVNTFAGTTPNGGAGTASFTFLRQEVGARASALAGASSASIVDASSIWSNPASLVYLDKKQYLLSYQNQFGEFNAGYVAVAFPHEKQAFGVALQYYSYGTFTQTDHLGEVTGTFTGGDVVAAVSYSRSLSQSFSAGASGKFVSESIQNFSASAIAVDIGFRYESDRGRQAVALVVQNLGTQLDGLGSEKSKLPLQLRLGGMIRPRKVDLQISAEGVLPNDNSLWAALGLEYSGIKPMTLRAGWTSFGSNAKVEGASADLAGFSFGLGVELGKNLTFGYSLGSQGDLGENHRITISGGF